MTDKSTQVILDNDLKKPLVPNNNDPARYEINSMIVEKIWGIIEFKKLQNMCTQQYLDELVFNACSDCTFLQKKFKLATIDMVIDLVVVPLQLYQLSHR